MAVSYDDEVTSVVSADEHQAARGQLDDEVVEQSTISFVDDYDHEQDERRDLLYRNSRSAIERARERARQRYAPPEDQATSDDDDVVISEGDHLDTRTAASAEPPTFEPDDFIEDEAPTSTPAVDEHDDALLSEGIRTPTPRSRRLRRFRDERNAPKEVTATKIEPEPDVVEPELPPSAAPERGRFDSIPEISADIDLPLLRRTSSANAPDPREAAEPAPESSSYERALKRAHAMNHAARVEQNQYRRRDTPPIVMDRMDDEYGMPDLPEAVEEPVRMSAPAPEIPGLSGTSAVLHPRMSTERAQPQAAQASRTPEPARTTWVRPERPARRTPDARQSWWRGGRKNNDHQVETAAADDPEPVEGGSFDDTFDTPDDAVMVAPHQAQHEPDNNPTFDLRHDEDLASFRARLFSSEQGDGEADFAASETARSPISMARRERRPLVPPSRTRREAAPAPVDNATVMVEDRPRPVKQPQRGSRREPSRAPMPETRLEPEMLFAEDLEAWYEPEPARQFDVRDLIDGDTELLDMTIEIAPTIPKACVTCRSYRPSEQPGRGWCTNTWAFTHRQMVNEHDLACDSTIGCWWLPADEEVWLDEFDVAADATPRVDRLLARMDPERRAVGN